MVDLRLPAIHSQDWGYPANQAFRDIEDDLNGRLSDTQLSNTIGAATAGKAKRGVVTSSAVGALYEKMRSAVDPCVMVGLGDSTMSNSLGWFNQLATWLGTTFPAFTVKRFDWESANERYNPVGTVMQTGAAGVRRFVASGASTDRIFIVADSAATSPVGDIDARFDVLIPSTAAAITLGGKYDTGTNNRSWFVMMNSGGTLSLLFSTDGTSGTQLTRTSTAAIPAPAINTRAKIRVSFDVDNGSTQNEAKFYYSLDGGSTWTQIGSTVTNSGVQSIFNGTSATQFNSRGLVANPAGGAVEYYGMELYTSLAAGARPVIHFETAQWNGYTGGGADTFTDFVGNTVQVTGTGSTGTMSGAPVLHVFNSGVSGQTISYANDGTRFPKLTPTPADLVFINFSHNEVGNVAYRTPYKTLGEALVAKWPDVGVVATIQNQRKSPASNIDEHAIRGDQIRSLAAGQRYAVVDIRAAFAATGNPDALVDSDGIHPTPDGYTVATLEAVSLFQQWGRSN